MDDAEDIQYIGGPVEPTNNDPDNPLDVIDYNVWLIEKGLQWRDRMDEDDRINYGRRIERLISDSFRQIAAMQKVIEKTTGAATEPPDAAPVSAGA